MKSISRVATLIGIVWGITPAFGTVVINFDDRAGMPPPVIPGTPIPAQYIVHNQYLGLGVSFDSAGGGIWISAPLNPVSAPNVAGPTGPGPVISPTDAVDASFWLGGAAAVTDSVSITLTNSSSTTFLDAFDGAGALLGSTSGGASQTLTVAFPSRIHAVRIRDGAYAFDNFTFTGLAPEPGTSLLFLLGVVAYGRLHTGATEATGTPIDTGSRAWLTDGTSSRAMAAGVIVPGTAMDFGAGLGGT